MMWAATGVGVSALGVGGYLAVALTARRRPTGAGRERGWAGVSPRLLGLGLVLATLQGAFALAGVLLGQWSVLPWYLLLELVTLVVPGAAVVSAARELLDERALPAAQPPPVLCGSNV